MKHSILILWLVGLGIIPSTLSAQAWLQRPYQVRCQECSMKEILVDLEHQSQLAFLYSDNQLPHRKRYAFEAKPIPLAELLDSLLAPAELTFRAHRRQIWVFPAPRMAPPPPQVYIRGKIADEETGEALIGARLSLSGKPVGALSDYQGDFKFPALAPGTYEIEVRYIGYESKKLNVRYPLNRTQPLEISLKPAPIELGTAMITSDRVADQTTVSHAEFNKESMRKANHITKDPIAALTYLPGITNGGDLFDATPSIRGGSQDENLILLDGVQIVHPWYTIGKSYFNPEIIDQIEVLTGGFPANYGNHMSSVMNLRTRNGDANHFHTRFDLNVFNRQLTFEGPIAKKKLSFLISWRRSHAATLAKQLEAVVPTMRDANLKLHWKISDQHQLSFTHLNVKDSLSLANPQAQVHFRVNNEARFNNLQWHSVLGKNVYNKLSLFGYDRRNRVEIGPIDRFRLHNPRVGLREDLAVYLNPQNQLKFGVEYVMANDSIAWRQQAFDFLFFTEDQSPIIQLRTDTLTANAGAYAMIESRIGKRFGITGGLRWDYFNLSRYRPVSPRLAFSYDLSQQTRLRLAMGHYYQFAPTQFQALRRQLRPSLSQHLILGIKHRFNESWSGWLEAYYKDYRHLIGFNGGVPAANRRGRAQGIEAFIKKEEGRFTGWLSYALANSKRRDNRDPRARSFDYDQRHTVNLVGEYRFGEKSKGLMPTFFNFTYRLTSGRPFTQVTGWTYDGVQRLPQATDGPNGARLPFYQNLNAKLIWIWPMGKGRHSFSYYLEAWNIFNRDNLLNLNYRFDPSSPNQVRAVPTSTIPFRLNMGLALHFYHRRIQ